MNIQTPAVEDYLARHYRPLNAGFWSIRLQAEQNHIPILTRDTEDFIRILLHLHPAARILEIGTAIGYSAAFMAALSPGNRVESIEKNPLALEEAARNLRDLGVDGQIRLIPGDAIEVLAQGQGSGLEGPYDLIFIDGAKSRYRALFDLILPLLAPGGILLCDNVLMRGTVADDVYDPLGKHKTSIRNMRGFLEYLKNHDAVDTVLLPVGDGLSVSIRKDR